MVRAIPAAAVLLLALAPLAACDDSTGLQLALTADTVTIAVPGGPDELATALDFVRIAPPFTMLRRPERTGDAEQWDFALRRTDAGGFALRPYTPVGPGRGAGIALSPTPYEQLDRAPRGTGPYDFETIRIAMGATYVARSRPYGAGCANYAKLKVVGLDGDAGTARFAVTLNDRCEDDRLDD